jgi:hypothetical protein
MNKRYWLSVVVVLVLLLGFGYLIHGVLLADDYGKLPNLFRTAGDQQAHGLWMLLAHGLTALAFVWVYQRGREDKPALAQGVRFGLAMAVLMSVAKFLVYFAVEPMPGDVVLKQVVFETIEFVIIGSVVAQLNR